MGCRKSPSKKHFAVAKALLEGASGFQALRGAGYGYWASRRFGRVLKKSWPLREAIRLMQKEHMRYFVPRPKRKRYDRRAVAQAVRTFCQPDIQAATSNRLVRELSEIERKARSIADGRPMLPVRCSVCRGPLEGKDRWCPNCQRIEA